MELGKLATPEETCDEEEAEEEGAEGKNEKKREIEKQYEEEEDEKDVKNEEKVSLLEDRMSPGLSCETSSKSPELPRVTDTVVVLPNPYQSSLVAQARLSPADPDIQLAEPQRFRARRLPSSLTQLSSIHTVCGPRPARISAACLLVLSIWAAFMLLIHMNKKIDHLSTTLDSTNDKLKTMEEVGEEYRSHSLQRLHRLGKLVHSLREGGQRLARPPKGQAREATPQTDGQPSPVSSSPPSLPADQTEESSWSWETGW